MACACTCGGVSPISSERGESPPGARLAVRHLRDPWVLLATGFGCGLARWAPGTIGSALGLGAWWLLLADLPLLGRLAVVAVAAAAAWGVIHQAVSKHGLGDAPAIVLDEVVGLWLALLAAPKALAPALAGFVLFRAADIAKPWPVSWADAKVKGAAGILLDDVLAGGMAAIVLAVGVRLLQ